MRRELSDIVKESDSMYAFGMLALETGHWGAAKYMQELITTRFNYLLREEYMTDEVLDHLAVNKETFNVMFEVYKVLDKYK